MGALKINDLNSEVDRIGLVAYDNCAVTALDDPDAEEVVPYAIVRFSWGIGDTDYYRAGELAEALATIEDDADPEEVLNDFPEPIDPEIQRSIQAVADAERKLEKSRRDLARAQWNWHLGQPVDFARFQPVRYVRGGNTDYCYGTRGEVVACWNDKVIKDERRVYAVTPSPEVDRINGLIAELVHAKV